jgi:Flp pilus assembly protein TadD
MVLRKYKLSIPLFIFFGALIVFSLAVRTIVRNSNWQSTMTLYRHDAPISDDFYIEDSLGAYYYNENDFRDAFLHFNKSAVLRPNEVNLFDVGLSYESLRNMNEARKYYELALQAKDYNLYFGHRHGLATYIKYAQALLYFNQNSQSIILLQNGLHDYPNTSDLYLLLAIAEYKNDDYQGALLDAKIAYTLNPNQQQNQFMKIF